MSLAIILPTTAFQRRTVEILNLAPTVPGYPFTGADFRNYDIEYCNFPSATADINLLNNIKTIYYACLLHIVRGNYLYLLMRNNVGRDYPPGQDRWYDLAEDCREIYEELEAAQGTHSEALAKIRRILETANL